MNPNDFLPPVATANTTTKWSEYQQAIFSAITDSPENLIVEAVAGSGKTTTLIEAINRAKLAKPDAEILTLAFNKAIAAELQARVPYGVEARTFHSLGLMTFRGKRPRVTSYKLRQLLKNIIPSSYYEEIIQDALRAISLIKANAITRPDPEDWLFVLDDFAMDVPETLQPKFIEWCQKAFDQSLQNRTEIDFDDMLFHPIYFGFDFPQYDLVLVDEAQDLSPVQHEIVIRLLKPNGRVVAVGDTHQAIYGFRGADHNSMNRFRSQFNTTELPLSISYRCPVNIVQQAQHYVPHIQAWERAKPGHVDSIERIENPIIEYGHDDLFVCRNNAPLFRLAMKFVRARHPVTVRGSFGDQLISFVKNFKTKDINVFLARLEAWHDAEYGRLIKMEKFSKASIVRDKYESLIAVAEGAHDVNYIIDILNDLFKPGRGATLSSIHRAKGTEAKNIHFYLPSLLPSKFASTPAQVAQENNLSYVGITRSLSTLTYIEGE